MADPDPVPVTEDEALALVDPFQQVDLEAPAGEADDDVDDDA